MAIHQIKKQSDLEKRLRLLRQQVYGKNPDRSTDQRISRSVGQKTQVVSTYAQISDITYLRQDLFKIATLASLALAIQFVLFFLLRNNILRINLL